MEVVMPIYEYQCSNCSKRHEIWQKISNQPKKVCPDCSGPLHKLISMSSFHLKGGGWYSDGYSSTKNENMKKIGNESVSKMDRGSKSLGKT
jgi:putative FmdB family regulatory protein